MSAKIRTTVVLILLGALILAGVAIAAPAAITVDRYVIGGGGGRAEADVSILEGTIGQPVVGRASGGSYQLDAGFWPGARGSECRVYLPLAVRGNAP